MVNHAIVEGIRNAVFRGESLKQAMMSFYNAGYDRDEIEQAAKAFQEGIVSGTQPAAKKQQPIQKQITPKQKTQIKQQATKVSSYGKPKQKKPGFFARLFKKKPESLEKRKQKLLKPQPKKVSDYKEKKPTKQGIFAKKWFVITLIVVFIILVGILISLFLFKDQLVGMLG